jgi:hypothetical protein
MPRGTPAAGMWTVIVYRPRADRRASGQFTASRQRVPPSSLVHSGRGSAFRKIHAAAITAFTGTLSEAGT